MKIWVDADACPKMVKEVIYKVAVREKCLTSFVANSPLHLPPSPFLQFIKVKKGADVADSYIVDHVEKEDIVITADIPLAALIVEKGVVAINPRGELYTEETISERLSVRNFMQDLRDSGMVTGGPAAFDTKDRELFTNSLHRIMTQLRKNNSVS
jgi:uncharacterized protein